jgi:hypothetical protein
MSRLIAGWLVIDLLGQNEFAVSGDAQVVLLLLVHDHDLAGALKQVIAFNARFFPGRDRGARRGFWFDGEVHRCFSHWIPSEART